MNDTIQSLHRGILQERLLNVKQNKNRGEIRKTHYVRAKAYLNAFQLLIGVVVFSILNRFAKNA